MHKKLLTGFIVASAMIPLFASAQATDVQSQIQSLLSQIQALQQQIKTLLASSTNTEPIGISPTQGSSTPPWEGVIRNGMMPPGQIGKMACITLNRNLGIGSHGDDVKNLQQMLQQDPESNFHGSATGFFGPMTAKAMMMYQMHMGIASSSTGEVGPMTRSFLERQCGKGLTGGMNAGSNDMMRGPGVSGTITANSGSSITIQNKDGKSIVVNVSASTTIMVWNGTSTPPTAGTISDLVVGKVAAAQGQPNSDGSLNAMNIKVGTPPPPPPPPMKNGDHGEMKPYGAMPISTSTYQQDWQGGRGPGGPQNW